MSKQTTNHSWTIPTVGGDENSWGQILNDFFDNELDRQVTLEDTFANRPSATSSNVKLFLATDRNIVYYNDGSSWTAVYGVGTSSNPVPNTSYFNKIDTDSLNAATELQVGGSTAISGVVASGQATLSSGSATVDTGVSESTTATFMVAFGPVTDDAQVAADIQAASGGNYEVQIEETDTSVGNPTVEYDILRVR